MCGFFFARNYFPAVFNVCLPFLLKIWRDSNILMIVSILFMTSTPKKWNKIVRLNWRMCIFLFRIKKGKMAKILKGRFHPRNKKVYFSKLLMGILPYAFFHRILNLCVYCAPLLFLYAIKRCFNIEFVVFEQIGKVCVLLIWKLKNELCCFFPSRQKKCGSLHRNCGNCSSFVHSYREIANRHHYIVTIGH